MDHIVGFLSMGGYWPYIWPAYGVAALGLGGLLVASLCRLRANEAALRQLEAERPRRSRRETGP
jgi:heme exporter protein CcmD